MSNDSKLLAGLIIGAAAGVAIGILIAPNSGKETRDNIKKKTDNLKDELEAKIAAIDKSSLNNIKETMNDIKEGASEEYQNIAIKVKELEHDIEARVEKLKALLNNSNSQST